MKYAFAILCCVVVMNPKLLGQDYYADYLSLAGGYYVAANSSTSGAVDIGYMVLNQGEVIGGELHMKTVSASVFGVDNVGVTAVTFSSFYGMMFTENDLRPYIAGGIVFGFNALNSNDITSKRPELVIKNDMTRSIGLFGVTGVQYFVSKRISLFTDVRYGIDYFYAYIEHVSDEYVNLGGLYSRAGIRITLSSSEDL